MIIDKQHKCYIRINNENPIALILSKVFRAMLTSQLVGSRRRRYVQREISLLRTVPYVLSARIWEPLSNFT